MIHRHRVARVAHCVSLAALAFFAAPAVRAQGASFELPEALFGHLDQHKTKCGDLGCGPTAVVNSFVYLQTHYSGLSMGPKAPAAPQIVTDTSEAGLIALADWLGGLMGCSASCGTGSADLFKGKNSYLDGPGRTGGWLPKTDWNPAVTWKWVTDTLTEGVDIELLVSDGSISHYLTLTGYTWTDANANGRQDDGETTVGIIDPDDGSFSRKSVNVDATGHMTLVGYDLDETTPAVPRVSVTDGFSEKLVVSSVPEPGVWGLYGAGLLALAWRRRIVR